MKLRALAATALFCASGCFRTVYINLQPADEQPPVETPDTLARHQHGAWHSFFLYGWIPSEKHIDAVSTCGGEGHVVSLETQQTVWQVLVSTIVVAAAYIGVYSPWSAKVVCDHDAPHP